MSKSFVAPQPVIVRRLKVPSLPLNFQQSPWRNNVHNQKKSNHCYNLVKPGHQNITTTNLKLKTKLLESDKVNPNQTTAPPNYFYGSSRVAYESSVLKVEPEEKYSFLESDPGYNSDDMDEMLLGLDQILDDLKDYLFSGGADVQLDATPVLKFGELDPKIILNLFQCAMCFKSFTKDSMVKMLPCNHIFHRHCTDVWFKTHSTCAVCKKCIKVQK